MFRESARTFASAASSGAFSSIRASSFSPTAASSKRIIASADWMGRNLDRRVELAVPVLDPVMAETLASQILAVLLADNVKSRELRADGTYTRLSPGPGEMPVDAQRVFLAQAQGL